MSEQELFSRELMKGGEKYIHTHTHLLSPLENLETGETNLSDETFECYSCYSDETLAENNIYHAVFFSLLHSLMLKFGII